MGASAIKPGQPSQITLVHFVGQIFIAVTIESASKSFVFIAFTDISGLPDVSATQLPDEDNDPNCTKYWTSFPLFSCSHFHCHY